MAKSISLEAKKAYVRKSRSGNYTASMRLEGIIVDSTPRAQTLTKSQLIAKYKASANTP